MRIKYLYQRNGVYWFQGPSAGGVRPKPFSLQTRDIAEAIDLREELLRNAREATPSPVREAAAQFLDQRRTDGTHTTKTHIVYRSALSLFCDFVGRRKIDSIDVQIVKEWQAHLHESGLMRSTIAVYLSQVRAWLSWCRKEGLIYRSPFSDIKIPRNTSTKAHQYYEKGARDAIIRNAMEISDDLAWVAMLGFHAGMRYSEIVAATPEWITEGQNGYVINLSTTSGYSPKWHKTRSIPCNSLLSRFIGERLNRGAPYIIAPSTKPGLSQWRWNGQRQWLRAFGAVAAQRYGYHAMRHTFATIHVSAGTSITIVAKWLGVGVNVAYHHYSRFAEGLESIDNAL